MSLGEDLELEFLTRWDVKAFLEVEKAVYEVKAVDDALLFLRFWLDWDSGCYELEERIFLRSFTYYVHDA